MLKKFKAFYNRDDFDYSNGLVDPFKFHTNFYRMLVAFKVAKIENTLNFRWLNQNLLLTLLGLSALILFIMSSYHGVKNFDIPHITEPGSYVLVLVYKLIILYSAKVNLPQYQNLLKAMKEDFNYICTDGSKYRDKYFKIQVATWKLSLFTSVFPMSIGIGMAIYATISLLLYLATHKEGDEEPRPLLFPFWIPGVDFRQTPYYEIAFGYSNTCVVLYGYNFVFMIQTQTVWIRQITSKVDIIVWCIQDLMDGIRPATTSNEVVHFSNLIESRIRTIVMHHQAMLNLLDDYALVYKKMLLYEQMICGPVVCLTAYCTAEKLDQGEFQLIQPLLFVAVIVLHFIPSYFCTYLAEKTKSICSACWDMPFWNAPPMIRPYMVLIMQRSLRPLPLAAPGFEPISLQTFSNKMTSAYSCFNMLRQMQK